MNNDYDHEPVPSVSYYHATPSQLANSYVIDSIIAC